MKKGSFPPVLWKASVLESTVKDHFVYFPASKILRLKTYLIQLMVGV